MNKPLHAEQGLTTPVLTWQLVHAVPGALVYAASSGDLPTHPLLRHSDGEAKHWVPSGEPEADRETHHRGLDHPVLHYAGYIGRVGLLAAALGAGAAFAARPGVAAAEPASSDSGSSSSSSGSSSSDSRGGASSPGSARSTAQAHGTMTPRNFGPRAAAAAHAAATRAAAANTVVANTTVSQPDAVVYEVSGGPSNGTVTFNPRTGAFGYTPAEPARQEADNSAQPNDNFSVTVADGQGAKATVPVSVASDPTATTPTTTLTVSDTTTNSSVQVSVTSGPATYLVVNNPDIATVTPTTAGYAYTPTAQTAASTTSLAAVAPAAQTTAVTTVVPNIIVEAESMALSPTKAGSTYSDATASGTKALLVSKNGTASTTLSLPDSTSVVIRAKGDQYKGAPSMTVSVDGKAVSTIAVSSTTWTDYNVPIALAAGQHTISIAYTNDLTASARNDRNLRIDKLTVVGAAVQSQGPAYFSTADWLWKPIASNAATAANSSTWVSYLSAPGQQHLADVYNYGVTIVPASAVTASTPRYDVSMSQPWGSDPFGSNTVPIPKGTVPPPGSDGQIAVVDPVSGQVFGIWQAKYNSKTNTWSGSWGGMTPINGNGIDTSGSATAAGISRLAGVVTAAELSTAIANNTGVNHALVFSSDIAGPGFVGPAIKSDGSNIAKVATPIPEGYRIQLDPSINVDALPGLTPGEKVIAKTLQTYGAYVVDQGSARMAFAFETLPGATSSNPGSAYTSAGFAWDYYDMAHIPWSSLRVLAA